MNADTSSSNLVHMAFRLLKQDSYYDKVDLFLRANVAAYEAGGSFQKRQDRSHGVVTIFPRREHPECKPMPKKENTTRPVFRSGRNGRRCLDGMDGKPIVKERR